MKRRHSAEAPSRRSGACGRDHFEALAASANLAISFLGQGKYAEAMEIERETFVSIARLLGAEHQDTLKTASNLAVSLACCGQGTECEQLLRNTLVVARRALGPEHEQTQVLR